MMTNRFQISGLFALLIALGACSATPDGTGVNDPLEPVNRGVHEFNKAADKVVIRPASQAYAAVVPDPGRQGISNFANNLSEPIRLINHTLQGDIREAGATFTRFGMNTVFGLGGLLDPATDAGVIRRETDFGETLAVWGVGAGPYVELPLLGPSTVRDTIGFAVDVAADPVGNLMDARNVDSDVEKVVIAADGLEVLKVRDDLKSVIDTLLYESADSYAAARIAYLQRRAAQLGGTAPDEVELEDPFDF